MKVYLKCRDTNLAGPAARTVLGCKGEITGNPSDANIIFCDHWVPPADHLKIYFYTMNACKEMVDAGVFKNGARKFPDHLEGSPNAFYIDIDVLPAFQTAATWLFTSHPRKAVVMVVDDNLDNLGKVRGIENVASFNKPEDALSFIQLGTWPITCVLTDMVMPIQSHSGTQFSTSQVQPSGILVCLAARLRGIPTVIVTAGHRATALEEFFSDTFAAEERIPIVHCGKEKTSGHWIEAYKIAQKQMQH